MDKETKDILSESKQLQSLVNADGWSVAKSKLVNKITDLQNAFNIEDKTPEGMLVDLKARKIATLILFDWIRDVEGTAQSADDFKKQSKGYIVKSQ